MTSISAVSFSAARLSADLFKSQAEASAGTGKLDRVTLDDDWCPTVPKKFPPPPPPSPAEFFERFAQIKFEPKHVVDDWCGTVPKRFPFPPPTPPGPWGEGLAQILATR